MRYPLRASIVYRWRDEKGIERRGRGWTQDVSEEGVLVSSDNCPAVGDCVDLILRVPSLRTPVPAPTLRMDMNAKVVRVLTDAHEGKNLGFAVRKRHAASVGDKGSAHVTWQCRGQVSFRCN